MFGFISIGEDGNTVKGITFYKHKFEQKNTRIAVFGASTLKSVEERNLIADIVTPNEKATSMSMALDQYIKEANKRKKKVN